MPDGFALVALLVATLRAATPLLLAGFGELVAERSGVLNLGVEGMMLVGAAAGFIATASTGNPLLGLAVAALAGALMALLFGFLTLTLRANQVACGLALTIFGVGLSALIGLPYQGTPITGLATVIWPGLDAASPMAQQFMLLDPVVWLALAAPFLVWVFLYRTRRGLVVRAVGESHDVAHALGYSVLRVRYAAVLFGGAMAAWPAPISAWSIPRCGPRTWWPGAAGSPSPWWCSPPGSRPGWRSGPCCSASSPSRNSTPAPSASMSRRTCCRCCPTSPPWWCWC